jgi:TonB family protein
MPPARTTRPIPWPVLVWLAGVIVALARIGVGHLRLARSLRRAREVRASEWIAARHAAAGSIGLRRMVKLRRSAEIDVPLTGGVYTPFVVLPEASEEWDAERRRIVLLHELTHARRRDPLLWLVARVAVALYWFHPLAWLAAARFRREQERSCDDAVVRAGTEQSDYAKHLVDLARAVAHTGSYAAALGMAATSDLEQRVRALLDARRNRNGLSRRVCGAAVAAVVAAVLPLAALHGQASQTGASLSGTVYDASGAVVPHILIILRNNTDRQDAARANAAGEYSFSVPAGSYTLEIRAPGFAEFRKAVVLPAARMNIVLDLGQVSEAVEVVGKAARPQETGTPHRIRVGGMVQATKLVTMTKPGYPPGAEAAGIEGTVLLRAVISIKGDLLGLSVINQAVDGELANAAMDAVKQWHYDPTLLNGEPVEVVTTIAVTFRLER